MQYHTYQVNELVPLAYYAAFDTFSHEFAAAGERKEHVLNIMILYCKFKSHNINEVFMLRFIF